ncbi:hypothetical protein BC937DRAFT_94083 [Endogone sp. FLAS-F59071]|nr:hypothetical protein BC937DRAFT_94083 [Endogone sp. FLAS-F59071]|eukprot:RUS14263.1 hypothetical protein BC937DRAFT_94083 [Endogone sp. FLAS-F59071]
MSKYSHSQPTARRRIPCESCRLRRRKCNFGSPCHRCQVSERECVYVRHLSPDDIEYEKLMSEGGENGGDCSEKIFLLHKQLELLENEISKFKATGLALPPESLQDITSIDFDDDYDYDHDQDPASPPSSESSASQNEFPLNYLLPALKETADVFFRTPDTLARTFDWTVTFMRKGLRINTNIRNFHDILEFLGVALENALTNESQFISVKIPKNPSHAQSEIFQKSKRTPNKFTSKPIKLFREVVKHELDFPMSLDFDRSLIALCTTQTLVENLFEVYFTCTNISFPTLHRETFMAKYYDPAHPTSSAFVNALCARVLGWRCPHIINNELLSTLNTPNLAQIFSSRARHYLEDLFDDISFSTFAATTFLAIYCFGSMRFKVAYLYRGHALRLAGTLVSTLYCDEAIASSPYPVDLVERETFKRLYWLLSGTEWLCMQLNRSHICLEFSAIESIHRQLGLPKPMPQEDEQTRKGVIFASHFLQFLYLAKSTFNAICILAPIADNSNEEATARGIPAEAIRESEEAVTKWYFNLPEDLQLSMEPYLGLTDMKEPTLQSPPPLDLYSIYLTLAFHIASIRVFELFLPELDEDTVSENTNLGAISLPPTELPWPPLKLNMPKRTEIRALPIAEKAQIICTSSAEVITILFEYLRKYNGCHLYLGTLLKACDIHYRNLKSPDTAVAASAYFYLSHSLRHLKEALSYGGGDELMKFAYLLKKSLSTEADELGFDI